MAVKAELETFDAADLTIRISAIAAGRS
jgi:hypothetical protein